jgi:hypothetical protein
LDTFEIQDNQPGGQLGKITKNEVLFAAFLGYVMVKEDISKEKAVDVMASLCAAVKNELDVKYFEEGEDGEL